ncbi:MAG: hypothetical protein J5727_00940 [Kiritimatiellae bacterium]|nr:hypothetical protein [Kiritimatiellia bacterium]
MKMKQAKVKLCSAVLAIAGMVAMSASATERTWVGASGGSWYVAENWDPSDIPGEKDTVVFRPESELTVTISATSGNSTKCRAAEIRFESGKTTFAQADSALGIYMGNSLTNVLYVAEDAEAVVSNRFLSTNSARRFRKTGGGKLTIMPRTHDWWYYADGNVFAGCDFAEGETILGTWSGKNYPLQAYPIHVCSGAVVRCASSYRTKTTQPLEIDYGGVFDCGGAAQYAKSVTGNGVVTNHNDFKIYLTGGVCTFAGQFIKNGTGPHVNFNERPTGMSDEDWGFVIGASNTFARSRLTQPSGEGNTIRFAPGIGDFWIKELIGSAGQYLTLEDTNGDPVTVRGGFYNTTTVPRFKGSGNFLCSLSAYIRSSDVVANMTGALGACNGATLTIGNDTVDAWPDISGLGGFIVENGTVALKNKNAGDAVVGGTAIFRSASCKLTATAGLGFGVGSTLRFEVPVDGYNSGVVPIAAPDITFAASTMFEADVMAYRKSHEKRTRLTLASASSSLVLPNAAIAASNARTAGYRFVKSDNSLLLEVDGPYGLFIIVK